MWGVGPATRATLERAGLRGIKDVQSRSREQLVSAFGGNLGEHLYVLANGLDERPVVSERIAKSVGHEMTFAADLVELDDVKGVLLQLAEMVGRRLRQAKQRASVIRLKLRHPPFETKSRQKKVAATADDLELYRVATALLLSVWDQQQPVRLLGVTGADLVDASASGMPPRATQGSLFDLEERPVQPLVDHQQRDRLLQAMDKIRDRHGEDAVRHAGKRGTTNPWGPETPE